MSDDQLMSQDEIEKLLGGGGGAKSPPPAAPQAAASAPGAGEQLANSDIEALFKGGGAKPAAAKAPAAEDDDKLLGQNDIEKLLSQAQASKGGTAPAPAAPQAAVKEAPPPSGSSGDGAIPEKDIEYLLSQAEQALESINASAGKDLPQGVSSFRLEEISGAAASTEVATLDLIRDVDLDLKIELGRTHMYLEDVLKLRKGSVVPLDKLAGDPVDIFVNGRLIARGEVLVLNDNFCVRVAELIAGTNVLS